MSPSEIALFVALFTFVCGRLWSVRLIVNYEDGAPIPRVKRERG